MTRIFISHAGTDDVAARVLVDWLASEGWDDVFLDFSTDNGIAPGERWRQALHEAANRCEAVLFLISPAWLASDWCRREFHLAVRLNKRMFAVIIEPNIAPDDIPSELTDTWQISSLASGVDHELYKAADRHGNEGYVTFSRAALKDLRIGLSKAGLDPKFFAWPPPSDPGRAPYRGLAPLDIDDAGIFFGREGPILEAMDMLRGLREAPGPRMVAIIGASGAGKSSFLRAGLLPRLARDDRNFITLPVIRPENGALYGGTGLLPALESALLAGGIKVSRATLRTDIEAGGDRLLDRFRSLLPRVQPPAIIIAIDQAEEAFTSEGRTEGGALFVRLRQLTEASEVRVLVILTIRSDAFEYLQTAPELEGASPHPFNLPPIPRGAYQTIIEGPAARFKRDERRLVIDPKLVAALLTDVDGAGKDALPLLSFTLSRLFIEHGGDGDLTLAEYQEGLGGLGGAIDSAVALAFAAADADPRVPRGREAKLALVRHGLIPWLAGIDLATNAPRRKVARWDDLPAESQPLIRRLVDQRLLATDVDVTGVRTVEPTHEALLRQWPTLRGWLAEDFGLLSILEGVQQAARDWLAHGRDPAFLAHTQGRLSSAELVESRQDLCANLLTLDIEYLDACRALEHSRRNRERARQRRLLWASIAAAVVLAATSALSLVQWQSTERLRRAAETAETAAVAARELEAAARQKAEEAQVAALDRQAEAARLAVLGGLQRGANVASPIRTLAANLPGPDVALTAAHYDLFAAGHQALDWMVSQPWTFSFNEAGGNWRMITDLRPSSGGSYVAVGLFQTWSAVIDTRTMRVVNNFRGTDDKVFHAFAFNDSETAILTSSFNSWAVFDRGDLHPRFTMKGCISTEAAAAAEAVGNDTSGNCWVNNLVFGPLGTIVGAHHDGARIFDAFDGTQLGRFGTGPMIGAELDSRGRYLLAYEGEAFLEQMSVAPRLYVWDTKTGQVLVTLPAADASSWIHGRLFGSLMLVLREGQASELWDYLTGRRVTVLANEVIQGYAIDPVAGRLASISDDGTVKVFDRGGKVLFSWASGILRQDGKPQIRIALGRDLLFVARTDGRIETYNQSNGLLRGTAQPQDGAGSVTHMAFVPGVDRLAVAHEDNAVRVWPLAGLVAVDRFASGYDNMPVQVGSRLVYFGYDRINVIEGPTLAILRSFKIFADDEQAAAIRRIEGLPEDDLVAFSEDFCQFVDIGTGTLGARYDDCYDIPRNIPVTADGQLILTAQRNVEDAIVGVAIRRAADGEVVERVDAGGTQIVYASFDPTGAYVVLVDASGRIFAEPLDPTQTNEQQRTATRQVPLTRVEGAATGPLSGSNMWFTDAVGNFHRIDLTSLDVSVVGRSLAARATITALGLPYVLTTEGEDVEVWDATTARVAARFPGAGTDLQAAAFGQDGTLVTATSRGLIRLWRLERETAIGQLDLTLPCTRNNGPSESNPDRCLLDVSVQGNAVVAGVRSRAGESSWVDVYRWTPVGLRNGGIEAQVVAFVDRIGARVTVAERPSLCAPIPRGDAQVLESLLFSSSPYRKGALVAACEALFASSPHLNNALQLSYAHRIAGNRDRVRDILEDAAAQESRLARYLLGEGYFFGVFTPPRNATEAYLEELTGETNRSASEDEAELGRSLMKQAADAGDANATLMLSTIELAAKQSAHQECELLALANGGEPRAALVLAQYYSGSQGALVDLSLPTFGGQVTTIQARAPRPRLPEAQSLAAQAARGFAERGMSDLAHAAEDLSFTIARAIGAASEGWQPLSSPECGHF
ncbi:MAG TPA: TIR domain-containing protein [Devosiaceae bacterium]|jgi:WD40 repeat protein|nr:TIR domain-containing protein [Devosiaceae bacterium]